MWGIGKIVGSGIDRCESRSMGLPKIRLQVEGPRVPVVISLVNSAASVGSAQQLDPNRGLPLRGQCGWRAFDLS